MKKKDFLYAEKQNSIAQFKFDKKVTEAFDDMIERSVPGYGITISMLGIIAAKYSQADS